MLVAFGWSVLRGLGTAASWSRHGRKLSILIYHRVLEQFDPLRPDEVDKRRFAWHMEILAEHFNVIPLGEAVQLLRDNQLPPRAISITFDDGYADNERVALPILNNLGLSATFFVATGFLDGGRMWNDSVIEAIRAADAGVLDLTRIGFGRHDLSDESGRLQAISYVLSKLKYLPLSERASAVESLVNAINRPLPPDLMMTSDQVRSLSVAGMEIGAHTVRHPILRDLTDADAKTEIEKNQTDLESLVGKPVRIFAYPNGGPGKDYTRRDVDLVKRLGFRAAVSTAWGVGVPGSDYWQLPRFTPWDRTRYGFVLRLLQNYVRRAPKIV